MAGGSAVIGLHAQEEGVTWVTGIRRIRWGRSSGVQQVFFWVKHFAWLGDLGITSLV